VAELLVAAQDLPSGYKKGDLIVVKPDGWTWGLAEGLPTFWQVTVSGVPSSLIAPYVTPLWEPAFPGDPEYEESDEEDRRILRHRRLTRIMWDEVPASWIAALETVGRLEIRKNQVRRYVRRLRYNRGQRQVEKTDLRVF